jgi:hypothetical protein
MLYHCKRIYGHVYSLSADIKMNILYVAKIYS